MKKKQTRKPTKYVIKSFRIPESLSKKLNKKWKTEDYDSFTHYMHELVKKEVVNK